MSGGIINIIPKLPSAADEYTPQQHRIIDARLARLAKAPITVRSQRLMQQLNSSTTKRKTVKRKTTKP